MSEKKKKRQSNRSAKPKTRRRSDLQSPRHREFVWLVRHPKWPNWY
jgi:hypothetical protein